ncbi:DUF6252 family protein [Xanthomarina gelatinilytica]|uniref:DUF6252 family protein n=1 Tax=Xanthomarina gelatinilytica TaxID=1137281 RepID=UPI003AA95A63
MKHVMRITLLTLFLSFMACSNDDDSNDNTGMEDITIPLNQMTFDITGTVEGAKSGFCYVNIIGSSSYMVSSNDGTSAADQTFGLTFYKSFVDDPVGNPAPGTYPIGTVVDVSGIDGFWVVYTDTQNDTEFGSGTDAVSGSLTIISNTNNELKGTFEFTATNNQTGESIQVTNGKFSAAID